jgi:putative CRISPR-associated protein (TIGR02620 family)
MNFKIINYNKMANFDMVITRHKGLVEYLDYVGMTYNEVVSHVSDPEILKGKRVLGVLPVNLASLCGSFTELALEIPQELRGKELDLEQIKSFARGFFTYKIEVI